MFISGRKRPLINQIEGENVWVTYMKDQVFNENCCINGVITGKPGSSKSWSALRLGYEIDPDNFKIEGNLFFKAGELMRAIKDYYASEEMTEEEKEGKIWILDEAGIDLNNMSYFDAINRGLNAFFQTARHRNYIFLMTVPFMNFVSKGVRTLMTAHFRAVGHTDSRSKILPRILEFNGDLDYFFKKRLLVKDKNGQINLCNELRLKKPPKHIIEEYEQMKKKFTADLFSSVSDKIDVFEEKREEKLIKATTRGQVSLKQKEIVNLLRERKTINQMAEQLNITPQAIRGQMRALERHRGFLFEPVKNGATVLYYNIYDKDHPPPPVLPTGFKNPDDPVPEPKFDKKKNTGYVNWD